MLYILDEENLIIEWRYKCLNVDANEKQGMSANMGMLSGSIILYMRSEFHKYSKHNRSSPTMWKFC